LFDTTSGMLKLRGPTRVGTDNAESQWPMEEVGCSQGNITDSPIYDQKQKVMLEMTPYVGQRLSLKKQTCTVRYIGAVADKNGEWLGVEWEDASRGKHDGTHDGVSYFKCR
jgi:hypothetical protein